MEPIRAVPIETLLLHRGFVKALARQLAACEADDVEQTAWMAAIERPPLHDRGLRAWLARLVRHRASDARRAKGRRVAHEAAADSSPAAVSPAETAARMEAVGRVVSAVAALPEPYRTTVVLRFYDDLSVGEIAARMGVPGATVRTRLSRAYARLRDELGITDESRDEWLALVAPWPAARRWTTAGAAGAAGAIVMSIKTWVAAGVAFAAAAGVVWWTAAAPAPSAPSPRETPSVATTSTARTPPPAADVVESRPVTGPAVLAPMVVVEVRSLRDEPIAGASVSLRRGLLDDRPASSAGSTGADGVARLAASAGEWRVDVRAGGFADQGAVARLAATDAERRVLVRLGRGYDLRGFVRDESGAPVEGARVVSGERSATSDASGAYVLSGLGAGEIRVFVRSSARFSATPGVVAIPDVTTYDFRLVARAMETAVGVVLDDATSAPLKLAVVRPAVSGWNEVPSAVTGADGRFRIDEMLQGFGKALVVAKAGYVQFPVRRVDRADGVELRVRRGPAVSGVVSSAEGPVAGAEVMLVTPSPFTTVVRLTARTDAAGAYSFDAVPAGRSEISATATGFFGATFRRVDVPERDDVRADLSLTRGAVVEGRVVDGAGTGVAEAYVLAGGVSAWTDGSGSFRLEGVRPGAGISFLVMSAGHARTERPIEVGPGTNPGVVLSVAATASVRGRVTAADGRAIEDARVFVVASELDASVRDPMRDGGEERSGPFPVLADGSYVASAPPSAADAFVVVVRSASHAASESQRLELVAGQPEYRADVTLKPGVTIRGRVVCDGHGIAGAAIALGRAGYGYSEPPVRATTDAAGAFEIARVALPRDGRVHLRASAEGFADAESDVTGEAPVELVLERPLEIAGLVETADHAPLAGVHVAAVASDDAGPIPRSRFAFTDEKGRFRVEGLRPGSYRVTATRPPASRSADGVAAGTHDLVITFGP